jgi:AcrR family transcriptional regulator
MARTVDIANRTVRRDAFIDAAEQLFRTKGYEDTSVQDLLDTLGVSRGAFYHYFRSKVELLEAVVERMVTFATAQAEVVADDPTLTGSEKLRCVFERITSWKLGQADLMHAMLEAWISDENALMREKYRRSVTRAMLPLLTRIAEEGMADGSIHAASAEGSARTIIHLLLGFQDETVQLFVAIRRGTVTFDDAWSVVSLYPAVIDHAAGLPPGTFPFIDQDTLRPWFA